MAIKIFKSIATDFTIVEGAFTKEVGKIVVELGDEAVKLKPIIEEVGSALLQITKILTSPAILSEVEAVVGIILPTATPAVVSIFTWIEKNAVPLLEKYNLPITAISQGQTLEQTVAAFIKTLPTNQTELGTILNDMALQLTQTANGGGLTAAQLQLLITEFTQL